MRLLRPVIISMAGMASFAASAADVVPCAGIEDDAQRLSCFDARAVCIEIADDQTRLACFDSGSEVLAISSAGEAAVTQSEPVAAPVISPQINPIPSVPVAAVEPDTQAAPTTEPEPEPEPASIAAESSEPEIDDELFPVRGASRRDEDEAQPVTMTAVIVEAVRDGRKLTLITLDNGQVWREIQKSRFEFQPGMTVEISEGVLGSVNLKAPGMSKYVKVRRLQ